MISKSWIITSSTTPTSRLRPGYGEPRGLDESRRVEPLLQRGHHGIEPLDVPDLQHEPARLREIAQFTCLLGRLGEGLLHEHMLARFEQRLRDFKMRDRRRRDRDRIHERDEFLQRSHRLRAEFRSHLARHVLARVEDGGELCARQFGKYARMVFPMLPVPMTPRRNLDEADEEVTTDDTDYTDGDSSVERSPRTKRFQSSFACLKFSKRPTSISVILR